MGTNGNGRSQGLLSNNRSDQFLNRRSVTGAHILRSEIRPRRSLDLRSDTVKVDRDENPIDSAPPEQPVDLVELNRISTQYDDSPEQARIWLKRLGNLKENTDVSENLVVLQHHTTEASEDGETTYVSFLPSLCRWLKLWLANTLAARKKGQRDSGSRLQALKEQEYLHWICRFIQDYLRLDHAGLALPDIESLALCLFDICTLTSETGDIEDAVDILYAALLRWPYPPSILDQTLQILSRVRLYFGRHPPPTHLADCIKVLAEGSMRQDVIGILYKSIGLSLNDEEAGMTQIRVARGSVLILRGLINTTLSDGCFLVKFAEVMPALLAGTKIRNLRLCADILDFCGEFITEEPRLPDTISQDWDDTFIPVIRECAEPFSQQETLIARSQSNPQPAGHGRATDFVDNSANLQHYLESFRQINETLSCFLNKLMPSKSLVLFEYLMAFPEQLTEPQYMKALQHASDRGLLLHENQHSELYLDLITTVLGKHQEYSSDTRSRAAEIVGASIDPTKQVVGNESELGGENDTNPVSRKGLDFLLAWVLLEKDPPVLQKIVDALYQTTSSEKYGLQVVTNLDQLIDNESSSDVDFEERADIAAQCLRKVFLKTFISIPRVAVTAFKTMVKVVSPGYHSSPARLSAMTLLFRLRCDSEGIVYIRNELESESIAAALCRTRVSYEDFDSGNTVPHRGSTSTSSLATNASSRPRWMYPDIEIFPEVIVDTASKLVVRGHPAIPLTGCEELDIGLWLLSIIQCLQGDTDWETYSFAIVHLGAQLSNTDLFTGCLSTVVKLRQVLSDQISKGSFLEPPLSSGLKKHDVALCVFDVLTPLISFATMRSEDIHKRFGDDLVRCFLAGVAQSYEGTSKGCIHALSICCLELPASVASSYPAIVDRMSKNMTQSHLTLHILEFLAQVARLPQVHSKFREDEITMIFSICIQFLEKARDQHLQPTNSSASRLGTSSGRPASGVSFKRPPYRAAMIQDTGLPQYATALAFHTMIFWFLSLKLEIRARYVAWIVPRLVWKNAKGEEVLDEQSQAFIDMMQRAAFSDLGETLPHPDFATNSDGALSSASWIVGLSIITVETAGHTGITQITKRQASGTTYAMYRQFTAELPVHHAPSNTEIMPESADALPTEMLPPHVLLQMVATASPTSITDQPILLPKEDFVTRALSSFDRIPTVDSHKIGVLYIGPSQTAESEYLANNTASPEYLIFLNSIGYPVSLEPPLRFNPMGLQHLRDGKTTMAWRDRVTEIIYHVPTLMPTNLEDDAQCVAKKAHVGNDHVNIVFNDSGMPWNFDNFKSQLNYVNIVITPASRPPKQPLRVLSEGEGSLCQPSRPTFYKVHTMTKPGFPSLSPAADPKIISAAQLPQFVRIISLNANIYSQAWNARESGDVEFPSNWRGRLLQLKQLRERVLARMQTGTGTTLTTGTSGPVGVMGQGKRTPVPASVPGSRDRERETADQNLDGMLAERLDFSKWTL